MSRESALAKATGAPAPTGPSNPASKSSLYVSPRQAARQLASQSQEASITMSENTKKVQAEDAAGQAPLPPVEEGPAPIVVPAEEDPNAPVATEDPSLSSDRFTHLAKKEAKLQKDREAFKTERETMLKAKEKYEAIEKQFRDFESLRQSDPIAAMKLAGFTDTDIFNFYAAAEKNKASQETPEARAAKAAQDVIDKNNKLVADKEAKVKSEQDAATIQRFKSKITQTVTSNKEKYEYCNFNGSLAEDLIYLTVEQCLMDDMKAHPGENVQPISPQEAADMVEAFYEEQDKAMSKLKKRGYKEPEAAPVAEPIPAQRSRTLSNRQSPTVAAAATAGTKRETPAEKRQRLIDTIAKNGLRK